MKNELYKMIKRELLSRRVLKKCRVTKRTMSQILEEIGLEEAACLVEEEVLRGTAEGARAPFDVVKIAELCDPLLAALSDREGFACDVPQEGWLRYIYERLLEDMFPGTLEKVPDESCRNVGIILCEIISQVVVFSFGNREFMPTFDLGLIPDIEAREFPTGEEYIHMRHLARGYYIYEFFIIAAAITPHDLLGHVTGVHFVAMQMARQLVQKNVPVDLAMVSAACAAHDIGKFGCRKGEESRIARIHYYYTDQCLKRAGLPRVAHIASNHSTWDLELEDLSCENLLLIYADFRVKSKRDGDGKEVVCFYSLDEAFEVILGKLENVDRAKRDRYVRVYRKLRDFENYMKDLGVNTDLSGTDLSGTEAARPVRLDAALLTAPEAVERLKYLAIEHNIEVMHRFEGERDFGDLLESARSEKQWENIRAYVNTLDEYSTYLTGMQKQMAIRFLRELLMQRGGDIRRQAAILIGKLIAGYDEVYRKDLPEGARIDADEASSRSLWREHLDMVTEPDLHRTEQQHRWIGYTLKFTMAELMYRADESEKKDYLDEFLRRLDAERCDDPTMFILMGTLQDLRPEYLRLGSMQSIMGFCEAGLGRNLTEISVMVLRVLKSISDNLTEEDGEELPRHILRLAEKPMHDDYRVSVVFLKHAICTALGAGEDVTGKYGEKLYEMETANMPIFRENLKVDTPWVIKLINIQVMLDELRYDRSQLFYIAAHLSNLLKVSERVTVRHAAGKSLIRIWELLSREQQHEVVVELIKGLEIGDYQFSRYIPEYLGVLITRLHPSEMEEAIYELEQLLQTGNEKVAGVTLDTLGVMLCEHVAGRSDEESGRDAMMEKIAGMLLFGMSNYNRMVSQEAVQVLGHTVFGSELLTMERKAEIFGMIHKKMLTLISDSKDDTLRFFSNAASLNHIYRFISDHQFFRGQLPLHEKRRAAFFPGTFDPFSLGHKGIVTAIRDQGYEVYLALDEFSWSKSTQPRMHRRRIMTMSCADVMDAYIFPDDQPVNIANPLDIRRLKEILGDKELYIVVGSDVVANASSYRSEPGEDTIHGLNHIIFRRESSEETHEGNLKYFGSRQRITGKIVELSLPVHLEDISSTRIRENIDNSRDISSLIDPIVQSYIYDNALYLRQPMYKEILYAEELHFSTDRIGGALLGVTVSGGTDRRQMICRSILKPVETAELYEEFRDQRLAAYIRERTPGRILYIKGIEAAGGADEDTYQMILTETLAEALKDGYTYGVYRSEGGDRDQDFIRVLQRQGFTEIVTRNGGTGCYGVDMRSPVTILQNMSTVLKSPFDKNERVERVLKRAHGRLQNSLTQLFPDTLILSCDSAVMHHRLIEKITRENGVLPEPSKDRRLGPLMCVPFGKILNNVAVPNTVTKTLHLQKNFEPDLSEFRIGEYPGYAGIEDQVSTIRSFGRPVILVDDILHKGYRMQKLDPVLNANGVEVRKIIVGVLSGNGRDLMTIQDRDVDSVYYIPNLKAWFVESSQYPFIGGDGVERHTGTADDDLAAINLILPYVLPPFLAKQCSNKDIYAFSMVCLENARDILKVLEEEYQKEFQRKLTLQRISEVVNAPKLTDVGQCLDFDRSLATSAFIEDDIERLQRLRGLI